MRRGQAALEYLVTYGWAMLAILVVLGALAYFGLLSPSRYLPSRCDFGVQMRCADFILEDGAGNDYVQIMFRNNFGDDINITAIETSAGDGLIVNYDLNGNAAYDDGWVLADTVNISKGVTSPAMDVEFTDGMLFEGERQSVVLNIKFRRDKENSQEHTISGEIYAQVAKRP
ncbi:hypothetical protein GOV11_02070 [Candidatus Woesearchaeota archaeon]|nr:hypothetical protein [Candidatus Woesearchaeota archaeon]